MGNSQVEPSEIDKNYEKMELNRFATIPGLNPNVFKPLIEEEEAEILENFDFHYKNILEYMQNKYKISFADYIESDVEPLEMIDPIPKENLNLAKKINNKEHLLIVEKDNVKYLLKSIRLNYENAEVTEEDIEKKYPLQYFINKNILKELRIIRNHLHRFIMKCNGYYIDEENYCIYLKYDYLENSLANFVEKQNLNFKNKMKILKTLLELIKKLHSEGIICLDLSINSIRFTSKNHLKLVSFGNSFDMNSIYDIDRNSKLERDSCNIHYAPEINLKNFDEINWHSDIWSLGVILTMLFSGEILNPRAEDILGNIKEKKIPEVIFSCIKKVGNIHIQAILMGLLRIDPFERPTIFEIIDVYNRLIEKLNYEKGYLVNYTQKEILGNIL